MLQAWGLLPANPVPGAGRDTTCDENIIQTLQLSVGQACKLLNSQTKEVIGSLGLFWPGRTPDQF